MVTASVDLRLRFGVDALYLTVLQFQPPQSSDAGAKALGVSCRQRGHRYCVYEPKWDGFFFFCFFADWSEEQATTVIYQRRDRHLKQIGRTYNELGPSCVKAATPSIESLCVIDGDGCIYFATRRAGDAKAHFDECSHEESNPRGATRVSTVAEQSPS